MRRRGISKPRLTAADTISTLPDEILCHILSFLTTKEAVTTTVLSKRWTHLWLSVPNLHFTDIKIDTTESNFRFNESVYSVLASRDIVASNFVNSFSLHIEYHSFHLAYHLGFPNIVKWVNLIVQRKLKFLSLNLHVYSDDDEDELEDLDLPKLPVSIFTCRTLVKLDLRWFRVEAFSFSASSIRFEFPSLKTLHLKHIDFSEFRDFILLLSACPNLDDLYAFNIFFICEEHTLNLPEFKSLRLPKLTRADITQFWCSYFPVKAFSNLEFLSIDTFKLFTIDHRVCEVNQLQRPYDEIPIFNNLTKLELHYSWDLVVQVLHHCPKLQSLQLFKELCEPAENEEADKENWMEPELVPQCLLSYLRTCIISDFSGLQSEFMLAKYILKNAVFLQTMAIWSRGDRPEIERKLSLCPKASASCKLSVYG